MPTHKKTRPFEPCTTYRNQYLFVKIGTMSTWCSNQLSYNPTGSTTGIIAWPKEKSKAFFEKCWFRDTGLGTGYPASAEVRDRQREMLIYIQTISGRVAKSSSLFLRPGTRTWKKCILQKWGVRCINDIKKQLHTNSFSFTERPERRKQE